MTWMTGFFVFLPVLIICFVFTAEEETDKVLVEVTDAIEEEEEEPLVFKPSIVPATPQVLTVSSNNIIHEVDSSVGVDKLNLQPVLNSLYNSNVSQLKPMDTVTIFSAAQLVVSPMMFNEPFSPPLRGDTASATVSKS